MLDDKKALGRLPIGYGVVKLQGRYFEPFLAKFPLFNIKKGVIKDCQIKSKMREFIDF
ncbi:MAG: hypothetical protein KAJ51_05665 [Thermoplasmata archaeon]|nr:hypothetical protein [Thermoplasmata archaeon]